MRLALALLAVVIPLVVGADSAPAQTPLTLETYVELTLARLELAETTWQQGRAPSADEETTLWQRYDTTADDYLAFPGENAAAVDDYIMSRPDVSARIDQLSARISELIEQAE